MRPVGNFEATQTTSSSFSSMAPSQHSSLQHSPWHSPVPYLFGGLAAMLGLIAFALLILACSYWKLSGSLENREGEGERDPENGDEKSGEAMKAPYVYEEKIVVIMAGDEKPRFLATPVCSKAVSFGDDKNKSNSKLDSEKLEKIEKSKEESSANEETTTTDQEALHSENNTRTHDEENPQPQQN